MCVTLCAGEVIALQTLNICRISFKKSDASRSRHYYKELSNNMTHSTENSVKQ